MRFFLNIHFLLGTLLICLSRMTFAADPMLNGVAVHTDLGKEQFIGALYSNPLSDNPETLLASTQAMRMELKIISPDGVNTRRFERWWTDGVGNNNGAATLTEQAENMVKFTSMFKSKLMMGDTISISYEPGKGVNVVANDVPLGNIQNEKFFNMLLKSWIGKVPFSTEFKDGILKVGNVNQETKARFDKIKYTKERATEVASWSKIKSAAELAAEKEKEASKSAAASSADNSKQLAAQKAEAAKAEAAKLAAQKAVAAAPAAPAAPATTADDEDTKPRLTAQSLLARQFYLSDLLKKINTVVRYPKRALEKDQEGSVRIAVVIDRQGNIVSATMSQGSEFDLLNDAAMDAVNKAAPFPAIPEVLTGNTFEFTAPLRFKVPK